MTDETPKTDETRRSALRDFLDSPEMQELGAILRERDGEYAQIAARLAEDGIVGTFITTACPVQFEGTLDDGSHIYFRSRWDDARLDIWDPDVAHETPYVEPDGRTRMIQNFKAISASYHTDEEFGFAEASWLNSDDAEGIIRALVARHRATRAAES